MSRRLLFVCGAETGGAYHSTLELAAALRRRGHTASVLIERSDGSIRARIEKRLLNAQVKLDRPWLTTVIDPVRSRIGSRPRSESRPTGPIWVSPVPENAAPRCVRDIAAEAVIVSSIRRPAWRQIRRWCRAGHIPAVLYMRGVSELDQLDHPDGIPDFLFSNTRSVAERARAKGHEVTFIPSLVDLTGSRTESTREVALLVSPTELQGVEVGLMLAERRPDVRFVFQRSWSLDPIAETELQRRVAELPNVELREVTAGPDAIYRDARLLIAPHRVDNRPRVILEAQANGIPVLTTELPGLIDQMGDGGNSVALDGSDEEWLAAFSDLWDDDDRYESMSERARHWAARDEQDPETIVTRFEAEIDDVVSRAVER